MANVGLDDLPDEVQEAIRPHLIEKDQALDAVGQAIAKRRDEAKAARLASGAEDVWRACEEAYIGIDNANRAEFRDAKWSKPWSMDAPVTTERTPMQQGKSTVFVPLTPRYVDAAKAKLCEILLPPDDKPFSFGPTPVAELIAAKDDNRQIVDEQLGPLTRPARPDEAQPPTGQQPASAPPPMGAPPVAGAAPVAGSVPAAGAAAGQPQSPGAPAAPGGAAPGGQPSEPPQVPLTPKDIAEEKLELANDKAKKAEKRIYDWMVECQRTAEMRKVLFDAPRIGVGVLKGPYPRVAKAVVSRKRGDVTGVEFREAVKPGSKWIDPWNFFPDATCGEDIHDGSYCLERDHLSEKQLRSLKTLPGYIGNQIDAVIEEGPDHAYTKAIETGADTTKLPEGRYEVWYYYGTLTGDEMALIMDAAGQPQPNGEKPREVYAIVTLVNERVIKATINPLDSGSFPYHAVPWQRRNGQWWGIGVGEQIGVPQKIVNGATRAMLDNAGLSAGGQIVLDQMGIIPADGNYTIVPNKVWYKTNETNSPVRDAFEVYQIPNATPMLMQVIEYGLKMAEEVTSIPLISQGQSGPTTPDTLGATQLQNNNANQLLRSIGYQVDDYITEPEVRQYYEYLLLDPDVPDDEKGDYDIDAHGSAALVERAIQDQTLAQLVTLAVQEPQLGADPKKTFALFLKSKHLDPRDVQYTEEEQAKIDAAPKPQDPRIEVAQINAQAKQATQQADQQAELAIEGRDLQIKEQSVHTNAVISLRELEVKRELAMLDYANRHQITITQIQAQLAERTMALNTERELNAQNHSHETHIAAQKPPVQAPGRAAPGHAFDQSGTVQ